MTRRGYIHDELNTVFFWSPKCACTTLFHLLRKNFGNDTAFYRNNSKPWNHCLSVIEQYNYKSVVIARNPVKRIVSAYLNKFVIHGIRSLRTVGDLEDFSQEFFKKSLQLKNIEYSYCETRENDLTFEWFVYTLNHLHNNRLDVNSNSINGHWDSQVPPVLLRKNFSYDVVLKVEDLDLDLNAFCKENNLSNINMQGNKTRIISDVENNGYVANLTPKRLSGVELSYDSFISRDLEKVIEKCFWMDFRMFDYQPGDRWTAHGF